MSRLIVRLGLVSLLAFLLVPASAHAWTVTVNVHGAGSVSDDKGLLSCSVSPAGKSESNVTTCVGGTPGGRYNSGEIITLTATTSIFQSPYGWVFGKWVDSNAGGGAINCDPQNQAGDHFASTCVFQIWENLTTDVYFDDTTGPGSIAINSKPSSISKNTTATYSFSSDDSGASYDCRFDQPGVTGAWLDCGLPGDSTESYGPLSANGTYTFHVQAFDPTGNPSAQTSASFVLDTTAPTLAFSAASVGAGATTSSTSASFTVAQNNAEPSTITKYCRFDGAGYQVCAGAFGKSGLSEGGHSFDAYAIDAAGNVGPTLSRSWTVDSVGPVITFDGGPLALTNQISGVFTWHANEPVTGYECSLNGAAFADCDSGIAVSGLLAGLNNFQVRGTDPVGNTGAASTFSFTVDVSPPDTGILAGPAPGSVTTAASAVFLFGTSGEAAASYQCTLDGASVPCAGGSYATPVLAAGPHTFTVAATDAAGNTDPSPASASWTIAGGALLVVPAVIKPQWTVSRATTWIRSLTISGLPDTARVEVRCKGRGCPFKRKSVTPSGGKVNVSLLFKRKALRSGLTIEIRVLAEGMTGRSVTYKLRKGKKPLGSAILCIPPGASTPVAC